MYLTNLLKKIQKDAGIPASAQHGKPNMGHSKDEEMLDEIVLKKFNLQASPAPDLTKWNVFLTKFYS